MHVFCIVTLTQHCSFSAVVKHNHRRVWVEDVEEVWATGIIDEVTEQQPPTKGPSPTSPLRPGLPASYVVRLDGRGGQTVQIPIINTFPYDASHSMDLDDASLMNTMHEAPLLLV